MSKSRSKNSQSVTIKKYTPCSEECTGRAKIRRQEAVSLAVAQNAVNANMQISARALVQQVQASSGIKIPTRTAYRLIDDFIEKRYGSYEKGYQKLQAFLDTFQQSNSGAYTDLEVRGGEFYRAFLTNPHWSRAIDRCQRIYGTDAAFTKHKLHKGVMILLLTRDGNNQNVLLALALCPAEDRLNYDWFITNCKIAGIKFEGVPLFCDRGVALLSAATSHPDLLQIHCTRHIVGNMRKKFAGSFTTEIEGMIYNIQASATVSEYESDMGILKLLHTKAWQYVADIDPASWCVFPNIGARPLYGWRTTNFVEAENSSAVKTRFLPPLQFLSRYVDKMIDRCYERGQTCSKWIADGATPTPYALSFHKAEHASIGYYAVQPAASSEAYVWNTIRVPYKQRVNLEQKTCTWFYADQFQMPCRHIMAMLAHFNRLHEVFAFYDDCYQVSSYAQIYSELDPIQSPIDQDLYTTDISPPERAAVLGRHTVKRKPSHGEGAAKQSSGRCAICKRAGHNKRSCPHRDF